MMRFAPSRGFTIVTALHLTGCFASPVCEAGERGLDSSGQGVNGSVVLSGVGAVRRFFRAEVIGLPDNLQPDSATIAATARLALTVRYVDLAVPTDVRTQMPRLLVKFQPTSPFGFDFPPALTTESLPFPNPPTYAQQVSILPRCSRDNQGNCCDFAARNCASTLSLELERLDGDVFPPVQIDWTVAAQGSISTCPIADAAPTLRLTAQEPQ